MSGGTIFDQASPPRMVRDHQVCTLPSLQMAITDLIREADERGHRGPLNLAGFDPTHGVNVSLNDDGTGNLFIRFRGRR